MDRRRRAFIAGLIALSACLWLVGGCTSPPTQVLVLLDTDAPADRVVTFTVFVSASGGEITDAGRSWSRLADGGGIALPASFGIVPAPGATAGDDVALTVRFSMSAGSHGEPSAQFDRVARFRFAPHTTIRLGMFMAVGCVAHADGCLRVASAQCTVAQRCSEMDMTCGDHAECVAPRIDPLEAGVLDAGLDATGPDGCVRACAGRVCGSDGCGGTCGACAAGATCSAGGACVAPCVSACGSRVCGPDPRCGTSCGRCASGSNCSGTGVCVCSPGLTDCSGACANLSDDPSHCGACGTRCGTNEQCTAAACVCVPGTMRRAGVCLPGCGAVLAAAGLPNAGTGCCASPCTLREGGPSYDCAHCCESTGPGACGCAGGLIMCGGSCIDGQTDPNNCGSCGTVCATGACSGGVCACGAGQQRCGGVCINVLNDLNNCGACGSVCTAPGPGCCGGRCTSLNGDPFNCGSCGRTCTSHMCVAGNCV